ncbi:MAG: nicotinate-nucleotide--dimethylbenzimidazole phosphoribosyltransferase [Candidatus Omnitrophica bacterium]|nr:nicotinate-nucleotide--dimethylbenzimidazole phosphoribosyltransferase [Candidatus Omnitrophota bacterium]
MISIREKIAQQIIGIDQALMQKAGARLDSLTKPKGSLGRLEELAKQVVGITGRETPSLKHKVIFTLAGDHGVTDEGISAYPQEVTPQMVYNFLNGGAGINVLARHAGCRVVVADVGIARDLDPHPGLVIKKINYGTKNIAKGPAMAPEEAEAVIRAGIEIFEEEYRKGIDIIGTGDMGIGNTTASSAITACFTGKAVETVTGRGTGIDDRLFSRKIDVIKQALRINKPDPADPLSVLAKVGGFEIGGLSGIILAAGARKVPVVIDGFISGAAALVAFHIQPLIRDYLIASHRSVEQGHRIILEHIGLKPVLELDLRLGEGTGAALGINVVDAAVKIMNEMATFSQAHVSKEIG